jgi:hypothetical protein
MHTSPSCLLNLTETCTDYNRGGMDALCFNLQPLHMNGIRRMTEAQFRVVRKIEPQCGFRHRSSRPSNPATRSLVPLVEPKQEYLPTARVSPSGTPDRRHHAGEGSATTAKARASRAMTGKAMMARIITDNATAGGAKLRKAME